MKIDINHLEILKVNFNQLKEDYEKNKIDLLVARIEAHTIIRNLLKIKQNVKLSDEDTAKIASLIHDVNDLLFKIIDDIEIRRGEDYHF